MITVKGLLSFSVLRGKERTERQEMEADVREEHQKVSKAVKGYFTASDVQVGRRTEGSEVVLGTR